MRAPTKAATTKMSTMEEAEVIAEAVATTNVVVTKGTGVAAAEVEAASNTNTTPTQRSGKEQKERKGKKINFVAQLH